MSPNVYSSITHSELLKLQDEIFGYITDCGLKPFKTIFELIDFDQMNEIVSYAGFPSRYSHWRFGMEYEALRKFHTWGLQKVYELVINNDPAYAYLMKSNSVIEQKLIIAHVYAHTDFFRNNKWFEPTNKKMLDKMANHGARMKKYMERFSRDQVEDFIDTTISIEDLIDYHSMYTPSRLKTAAFDEEEEIQDIKKIPVKKDYLDRFINPPEFIESQKKRLEQEKLMRKKCPEHPERDIFLFLIEYAPLENWQRDILSMIRDESYYFAPQGLTKIMNEGWAAYWHSKILTENCLNDDEAVDYADLGSLVLGGSVALNPYKLGLELFRDIEERWNKGRFGIEYEECDDLLKKQTWDMGLNQGRAKIFEVRHVDNDVTFLDNYLTEDFCERYKLFIYKFNQQKGTYEIASRDFPTIKRTLLFKLTNMGRPIISVIDGNFKNRGELLLKHHHEGVDLEIDEAKDTLRAIFKIWQRPVNLWTVVDPQHKLFTFDGTEHKEQNITESGP